MRGRCKFCEEIEDKMRPQVLSVNWKNQLLQKKQQHLASAEKVRNQFIHTIERSLDLNSYTEVYTFSMQRSLDVPSFKRVNDAFQTAFMGFQFLLI